MVITKIELSKHVNGFIYHEQGDIIYELIVNELKESDYVEISLNKIDVMTSSFLNSSFVRFADEYNFDEFKQKFKFVNGQPHINKLIIDRIKFAYSNKSKI